MFHVEIWTVTYAPWEEGADEREKTGEDYERIDFVGGDPTWDLIEYMRAEGFSEPSSSEYQTGPRAVWWSEGDPYEDPYSGVLTWRTLHINAPEDVHRTVWDAIAG